MCHNINQCKYFPLDSRSISSQNDLPSKHDTFNQCWFIVGSASQTVDHYCSIDCQWVPDSTTTLGRRRLLSPQSASHVDVGATLADILGGNASILSVVLPSDHFVSL